MNKTSNDFGHLQLGIVGFLYTLFLACGDNDVSGPNPNSYRLSPPSDLTIALADGQFSISWKDNATNEDGHRIERAELDSVFTEVAVLSGDSVMTYQESAQNRLFVQYRVSAFKNVQGGTNSSRNSEISLNLGPNSIRTNLQQQRGTLSKVNEELLIEWEDNGRPFESEFILERKVNFNEFGEIARIEVDNKSFVDSATISGRYIYQIKAVNNQSESLAITDTFLVSGWIQSNDAPLTSFSESVELLDGRVFCSDAGNGGFAIFNPTDNSWSEATTHSDQMGDDSVVLRLKDGNVLILGIGSRYGIYDVVSDRFFLLEGTTEFRDTGFRATTLDDGNILITGQSFISESQAITTLYIPESDTFTVQPEIPTGRRFHTSTLLPDENVLVTGGQNGSGCSLYDPQSQSWSFASPMPIPRVHHIAILLENSKVLVCGDNNERGCELYDPTSDNWTVISPFNKPEILTAVKLHNGKILAITGDNYRTPEYTELYDPDSDEWIIVSQIPIEIDSPARGIDDDHAIITLSDTRVLFTVRGNKSLLWRN